MIKKVSEITSKLTIDESMYIEKLFKSINKDVSVLLNNCSVLPNNKEGSDALENLYKFISEDI